MAKKTQAIQFWNGGPDDGAVREFTAPFSQHIEILGSKWLRKDDEGTEWLGRKIYDYVLEEIKGRLTYVYYGERLEETFGTHREEPEEVTPMGIRKHGVGEIIDDDKTEENLSKQAAAADWKEGDEQALLDENEG